MLELKTLYELNRTLISDGFDKALHLIGEELPGMRILEFPTGSKYGTWKIPQKWEVKEAWVKYKGKKIIDIKKEPLSVLVGSEPTHGIVDLEELQQHLFTNLENKGAVPYAFCYYDKQWGFSTTAKQFGELKKGEYEVFIDSKKEDGTLKIGEYVVPGGKKEVLIMAHLDHPFQANDNLSGVMAAIKLAKTKCDHTLRIVFVPETIGSIVYAHTQDLKNVDFMIALDMVGNDNTIMMQQTFAETEIINKAGMMAMSVISPMGYRKAPFRAPLGSDEYIFADPKIGIPAIMFARNPYPEYHSSLDTPAIVKDEKIDETVKVVQKTIELMENDYIPTRTFKGPLMRSRYGVQQLAKEENRKYDYFFYLMDGNRSLLELSFACNLDFETMDKLLKKMKKDGFISIRKNISK